MSAGYTSNPKTPGICDVCGFRYRLNRLKHLVADGRQTGTKACPSCWTPDQPQLQVGKTPVVDPQTVREPRVDTGLPASRTVAVNVIGVAVGIDLGKVTVSTT